jgi:methyl-accepting chemotaxis protein
MDGGPGAVLMRITELKIGSITRACSLLLVLLVILGSLSNASTLSELGRHLTFIEADAGPSLSALSDLSFAWNDIFLETSRGSAADYLGRPALSETADDALRRWNDAFARYRLLIDPANTDELEAFDHVEVQVEQFIQLARRMTPDKVSSFSVEMDLINRSVTSSLRGLVEMNLKEISEHLEESARARQTALTVDLSLDCLVFAALVCFAILLDRLVVRPLTILAKVNARFADGDLDAEVPFVRWGNEAGVLANSIRVFREAVMTRDELMRDAAARSQERLARHARTAAAIERFRALASGAISAVASSADLFLAEASEVAGRMKRVYERTESAHVAGGLAAHGAQVVAEALDELTTAVGEIDVRVVRSSQVALEAADVANLAAGDAATLAASTDAISAITALISTIASQTNMLALNATIEAARSGEAGRGFAVVAQEVKSLAGQTANAADRISEELAMIRLTAHRVAKAVNLMTEVSGAVSRFSAEISSAVSEQSRTSEEISSSLNEVAGGAKELGVTIGDIVVAAQEARASAGTIEDRARAMAGQADILRREVSRFLAEVEEAA